MKSSRGFVFIDLLSGIALMALTALGGAISDTVSDIDITSSDYVESYANSNLENSEYSTAMENHDSINNADFIATVELENSKTLAREEATVCSIHTNKCIVMENHM